MAIKFDHFDHLIESELTPAEKLARFIVLREIHHKFLYGTESLGGLFNFICTYYPGKGQDWVIRVAHTHFDKKGNIIQVK